VRIDSFKAKPGIEEVGQSAAEVVALGGVGIYTLTACAMRDKG